MGIGKYENVLKKVDQIKFENFLLPFNSAFVVFPFHA
jgi:hypothetical protein